MPIDAMTNNQVIFLKPEKSGDIFAEKNNVETKETGKSSSVFSALQNYATTNITGSHSADFNHPGLIEPSVKADPELLQKQLEQLSTSYNISTFDLQRLGPGIQELTAAADKSGVNIITLASSFTGKSAELLQLLIRITQDSVRASATRREATRLVSYNSGQASAKSTIQAGRDQFNQQLSSSITSSGIGFAGGVMQFRGHSKSLKSYSTHGNRCNELNNKADLLSSQAKSTKPGTSSEPDNYEILTKTANRARFEAKQEDNFNTLQNISAQKIQATGSLVSMNAASIGQMTSSSFVVAHAESQAAEQRFNTDQNVMSSASDSKAKDTDSVNKLLADLLALLAKIINDKTNTVSSMIKG